MANKEELRKEGINFLNYVCKKIKKMENCLLTMKNLTTII